MFIMLIIIWSLDTYFWQSRVPLPSQCLLQNQEFIWIIWIFLFKCTEFSLFALAFLISGWLHGFIFHLPLYTQEAFSSSFSCILPFGILLLLDSFPRKGLGGGHLIFWVRLRLAKGRFIGWLVTVFDLLATSVVTVGGPAEYKTKVKTKNDVTQRGKSRKDHYSIQKAKTFYKGSIIRSDTGDKRQSLETDPSFKDSSNQRANLL